jgi:hypothetical protein
MGQDPINPNQPVIISSCEQIRFNRNTDPYAIQVTITPNPGHIA